MNSAITEFRVALKELKESFDEDSIKKRCSVMSDLSAKMLRILETISFGYPELLMGNKLNMTRLAEMLLLMLTTVGQEGYNLELFKNFTKKQDRSLCLFLIIFFTSSLTSNLFL